MHRTRLARWRYPFNPAAKCEYSNNTLEPSACISGQGGKSEDLYSKGHEFKPALGISFWTTFWPRALPLAGIWPLGKLLLAGIWPLEKLNPRLDRFLTAEACNIAMGIFSSLCWEGVRFIPVGARIWHIGKAGLHILLKKEGSLGGFEKKRGKFGRFWKKTEEQRAGYD